MTLGQSAAAVGASPRWVLNALTRLRVPRRYGEPLARRLCVARLLAEDIGLPLPRAWELAGEALGGDLAKPWHHTSEAASLMIDLPRALGAYGARLALANASGAKRRGRRPARRGSATARAQAWGIDTTLHDVQLSLTPSQRLQQLDQNLEFIRSVRTAR